MHRISRRLYVGMKGRVMTVLHHVEILETSGYVYYLPSLPSDKRDITAKYNHWSSVNIHTHIHSRLCDAYHRWRLYTVNMLYTLSIIMMLPHLMTLWNYALWVEQDCMCRANQDMSIFFNEPMRKKNKQITYQSTESGHMFKHRHKIWDRRNLNTPNQSVILLDWVDWVFEKLFRELIKKEVGDKSLNSDSRFYLL